MKLQVAESALMDRSKVLEAAQFKLDEAIAAAPANKVLLDGFQVEATKADAAASARAQDLTARLEQQRISYDAATVAAEQERKRLEGLLVTEKRPCRTRADEARHP